VRDSRGIPICCVLALAGVTQRETGPDPLESPQNHLASPL
jgi:hypothetical protein